MQPTQRLLTTQPNSKKMGKRLIVYEVATPLIMNNIKH